MYRISKNLDSKQSGILQVVTLHCVPGQGATWPGYHDAFFFFDDLKKHV